MAKDPAWREFEKLVARTARVLAQDGAVITCPDKLRDVVTGGLREVDATIRPAAGAAPVRFLECRKRGAPQDVTWIEQVVTKSRDVGVPAVAISCSRFSRHALKKAKHYGIEARVVSKINDDEVRRWLPTLLVRNTICQVVIERIRPRVHAEPGDEKIVLTEEVSRQVDADAANAKVFSRCRDGKPFSARMILDIALQAGMAKVVGRQWKGFVIHFARGILRIPTQSGPRDIAQIVMEVAVARQEVPVETGDGFAYASPDLTTVYGKEMRTDIGGQTVVISFHKEEGSDMLRVDIDTKKGIS